MTRSLLSVSEARAAVLDATTVLDAEEVPVAACAGRVLAEDVVAAADVPGFANSAMDGYAVIAGPAGRALRIVGEARAGAPAGRPVGPGEAIRISTGAALPEGANAVVPVERTEERDGTVIVGIATEPGRHVREPGEDLRAGEAVLRAGTVIGAGEAGILVAAGRGAVRCARRPRVTVVCTGSELVAPGEPLGPGQIHNSNAVTLTALAAEAGAVAVAAAPVADDLAATVAALGDGLRTSDLLVISGGVSVGEHDHVKRALAELSVEERFWGIALKPGKPAWFGVARPERSGAGGLVLGLPGNPVSAMVTFTLFARPALQAMQGAPPLPRRELAEAAGPLPRVGGREQAVRVRFVARSDPGPPRVVPTGPQGSHVLSSMVGADALAFVAPGDGEVAPGEIVEIERLGAG